MRSWLFLFAAVKMALSVVMRWPLRTGLTALGILVGVLSVTVTVALGDGARAKVTQQIDNLGSNALLLSPEQVAKSGAQPEFEVSSLTERDVSAIAQQIPGVRYVAPMLISREQMIFSSANTSVEIIGTTLDFFPTRVWQTESGQLWDQSAEKMGERVCVIGTTVRDELFGSEDAVGRVVRIGRYPFRVLGVMQTKGQDPFGRDEDARVMMPIRTARSKLRQTVYDEVDLILVSAKSDEVTDKVSKEMRALLRERHSLIEGMQSDFSIRTQKEFKEVQERIVRVLNLLLVSIALVSLVVGGVGIMNIMLVSVSERTREIGIRLAIGARARDVLIQFLVEAMVLSVLGGGAGVLLAAGVVRFLGDLLELPMQLSAAAVALALGTSTIIGMVFGFLPARRAARLDPIEALRSE